VPFGAILHAVKVDRETLELLLKMQELKAPAESIVGLLFECVITGQDCYLLALAARRRVWEISPQLEDWLEGHPAFPEYVAQ
jgi:hypothetical protein